METLYITERDRIWPVDGQLKESNVVEVTVAVRFHISVENPPEISEMEQISEYYPQVRPFFPQKRFISNQDSTNNKNLPKYLLQHKFLST